MLTFIRLYIEVYFTCNGGLSSLLKDDFNGGSVFHIFYRNFGRAEENRSLYRGFRYIEVD